MRRVVPSAFSCRRGVLARMPSEGGFTLLEILVAFVILALGMSAISTGVAVAVRSDGRARSSRIALRVAESRLEAAGITTVLVPGQHEGRTESGYHWLETVAALRLKVKPPVPGGTETPQAMPANTLVSYWIEVVVEAPDGTASKLSALKLSPGAIP